jgi:lysophospholipase L1-like esterase
LRRLAALTLILSLWSGCGGKGSSSSGPTPLNPSLDFGQNNPSIYSAFGDSLTEGVERIGGRAVVTPNSYPVVLMGLLHGIDPAAQVANRGVGGETTSLGASRISGVLASDHPGFILILEGTNSLGESIVSDLRTMVRRAKANKTVPLVATIPPQFASNEDKNRLIQATNGGIVAMAAQEGVPLVDLFTALQDRSLFSEDGVHPNDSGYQVMAQTWFSAIRSVR